MAYGPRIHGLAQDKTELDEIVDVWDGDAILMAQKLTQELGIGDGISSGANVLAALQLAADGGSDAVVATVLPDSNKKYLSTDLCEEEPANEAYVTPEVELIDFRIVPRLGTGYSGLGAEGRS